MAKKIIIVGGGISGISSAIKLAENGFEVEIYEQKNNIGGRLYSLFHQPTNEWIDNGQHIMVGAYDKFFQILEKLNSKHLLYEQKALQVNFINEKNEHFSFDASKFRGKLGFIAGIFNFNLLNLVDKIRFIFMLKILYSNKNIDNISAYQLLKELKQSDRIINDFWEPLIVATLNTSSKNASAILFVNVMKIAFFADTSKAKIFIPNADFKNLLENFDDFLLKRNSKIHYNTKITKIGLLENKIKSIYDDKGNQIIGDYFILAVPYYSIKKISEEIYNYYKLENFKSSSITSIYLWYDRPFFQYDFATILGKNIQWIFNRRKIMTNKNYTYPEHLTITISNSNELNKLDQNELIELISKELEEVFPESKQANLISYKIIKEKNATFLADIETEQIRPNNQSYIDNLMFAGDWTNTKLPATIEGAALSGYNAAELIIKKSI